MQAFLNHRQATTIFQNLYHQPMQQSNPHRFSNSEAMGSNSNSSGNQSQETLHASTEQFFTLESTPAVLDYITYYSPSGASVSSNRSPFSPDCCQSHLSYDNNPYDSLLTETSGIDEDVLLNAFIGLKKELLGPEYGIDDSSSFSNIFTQPPSFKKCMQVRDMAPNMDLKDVLIACAKAISEAELCTAEVFMDNLEKRVSIYGDPMQRLSAYLLEGLRARLLSSGSIIYKKLKCDEATGPELMSYMQVLYQICPYYKFAYFSANAVISEAMENEANIHIIDFQIAQGSQWVFLIKALAGRPGGPPCIRITGVDDSQSAHARGGGLELVGQRLEQVANSYGVPFEFHDAALSGSEVYLENLQIRHGEALAVNFPYMLHHMPDESVSTANHRDRLLRLVKSLSPKIVTLVEQESNTNTTPFFQRFCETLDYYTAMFESIDAGCARDDKRRVNAEEHCVARDIVNMIACEGSDRVERHELFGKWRMRLAMAGFSQVQLSGSVSNVIRDVLSEYSENYRLAEMNGALYLGWKNRAMVTSSAWR